MVFNGFQQIRITIGMVVVCDFDIHIANRRIKNHVYLGLTKIGYFLFEKSTGELQLQKFSVCFEIIKGKIKARNVRAANAPPIRGPAIYTQKKPC